MPTVALGYRPAAILRVAALLLLVPLWAAEAAAAWEAQLTPEVVTDLEYSDNVGYAARDRGAVSDLMLRLTPALAWRLDREDLRIEGRSREEVERYLDHDELDGEDPAHQIKLHWDANERWSVELAEDFQRTRNLQQVFATGAVVTERQRLTTNEASATVTCQATERTRFMTTYTNYDSQSENPAFFDYLLQMGQVSASHQLTERFGVSLGANLQDYDFNPVPGNRTRFFTRNYGLFGGVGFQWSERFELSAQLGERLTEQVVRFPVVDATTFPQRLVEAQDTTSNLSNTFSLAATYRLDRGALTLNGSQDLAASAGSQGAVERRTLYFGASQWVAPDWQVNGNLGYATNKSDTTPTAAVAGVSGRNTRSIRLSAALRYRIDDHWSTGLTVSGLRSNDHGVVSTVRRNTALFDVTLRWPYLL